MNKIVLCAIAKCENRYITEWIGWHFNIGFDKIVIYDNNDKDGERIRDTVGEIQNVEIVDWTKHKQRCCEAQVSAYNDCYARYADWNWIMFLDIDEFLEFKNGMSVREYLDLDWVGDANAIKFHWKCYSDNGYTESQPGLVTETYTELCENRSVNRYTKTMYRCGMPGFRIVNVHYSSPIAKIYYQSGKKAPYRSQTTDDNINYGYGWIRHYVTKSLEEFVTIKYKRRGPGSSKTRLDGEFYFKYNKKTPEKARMLKELIDKMEDRIQPAQSKPAPAAVKSPEPYYAKKYIPGKPVEPAVKPALKPTVDSGGKYPFGISVCISAWKTAEYIEECLDSIAAQTWFKDRDNWEILLGIDGCEETLAKVREIMHKYKNLKVMMMDHNVGTYVTCNTIMKQAKYEWLLRFDSDDVMPDDMISKIFSNNLKGVGAIRYKFYNFGQNGGNGYAYGSHMVKHSVFDEFGGYREWRIAADYDFLYRIGEDVKILIIKNTGYKRRVRSDSLQFSKETNMQSVERKKLHEFIKTKTRKDKKIKCLVCEFEFLLKKESVAFIIPNRGGTHLNDVIKNINDIYSDYNVEILVVTQSDDKLFKRGQLCNIGLLNTDCEYVAISDNDIFHFTKINLIDEYKKNGNKPYLGFTYITQIKLDGNSYKKGESQMNTVGAGGFLFGKLTDFVICNGFSNLYSGWGCEDNELSCRLCNNNSHKPTLKHIDNELGHITHPKRINSGIFEKNRKIFFSRLSRNIMDDGLNQTTYNICSTKKVKNVTYIDVNDIGVCESFKYKKLLK